MIVTRATRGQLVLAMLLLLALHFWVRPRLVEGRLAPDFLFLAFILFAMHSGPGAGALAGFVVGLMGDALTPARFGAGTLAHTVVGSLAAWGRTVFFTDNLMVTAAFIGVGLWLRDLIVLLASGAPPGGLWHELVLVGLGEALLTSITGLVLVLAFRQWFSGRIDL